MFNVFPNNPALQHALESALAGALIAGMAAALQYLGTDTFSPDVLLIIFAGGFLTALVKSIFGLQIDPAALKRIEDKLAATLGSVPAPQGPLVTITHAAPTTSDVQVSGSALPREPQPIIMPQAPAPPPVYQPQNMVNSAVPTGQWQAQPPTPYQVDRNWTGLQPVVPPQQ